jgi:hypothetical protein
MAFVALLTLLVLGARARADCPPCFPGGGPAATDCFVEWGGIAGPATACADGDPACDTDGTVDGVCTFGLTACINVPDALCPAGTLSAAPRLSPRGNAAVRALGDALAGLGVSGQVCTPPGLAVPLKISATAVKPGKVRLRMTAASGGKRDVDTLRLTCLPGTPSFRNDIQIPIFTPKCATPGCHNRFTRSGGLDLEEGQAYANLVGKRSSQYSRAPALVTPASVRQSFLARKIVLGRLPANGSLGSYMPQAAARLSSAEIAAILEWIAAGAPES